MIIAVLFFILITTIVIIVQRPKFGKLPSGERKKNILLSPNYLNGAFQNLSNTPMLSGGISYLRVMKDFIFNKSKRSKPSELIPGIKTDLHSLDRRQDLFVWFGHSSYFLQLDGKRFLVDPVFGGHASPFTFTTPSYPGTDLYRPEDIPEIDFLLLSHDHWDHLDYATIPFLKQKITMIVTGLGTGEHLEHWGFDPAQIVEKDWYDILTLDSSTTITLTPGRHFSGRLFKRNQVLWTSFVLKTKSKSIFIGGDSGYDTHFKSIGEQFGPFDLVILESGQYNEAWHSIHMMPEETVRAAVDLRGKALLPVHWGKFALALHAWDDPIVRVMNEATKLGVTVLHPMIGEKIDLNDPHQQFSEWWKTIQ